MFTDIYSVLPAIALGISYYLSVRGRSTSLYIVWLLFAAYWLGFIGVQYVFSEFLPAFPGIFMGIAMALACVWVAKKFKRVWPLMVATVFVISAASYVVYISAGESIDRRSFQDFTAGLYYFGLAILCAKGLTERRINETHRIQLTG